MKVDLEGVSSRRIDFEEDLLIMFVTESFG